MKAKTHQSVAFGRVEVRAASTESILAAYAGAFAWVAAVAANEEQFTVRARAAFAGIDCVVVGVEPLSFTDDFRRVIEPTLKYLVTFALQHPQVAVHDELFTYEQLDDE